MLKSSCSAASSGRGREIQHPLRERLRNGLVVPPGAGGHRAVVRSTAPLSSRLAPFPEARTSTKRAIAVPRPEASVASQAPAIVMPIWHPRSAFRIACSVQTRRAASLTPREAGRQMDSKCIYSPCAKALASSTSLKTVPGRTRLALHCGDIWMSTAL